MCGVWGFFCRQGVCGGWFARGEGATAGQGEKGGGGREWPAAQKEFRSTRTTKRAQLKNRVTRASRWPRPCRSEMGARESGWKTRSEEAGLERFATRQDARQMNGSKVQKGKTMEMAAAGCEARSCRVRCLEGGRQEGEDGGSSAAGDGTAKGAAIGGDGETLQGC